MNKISSKFKFLFFAATGCLSTLDAGFTSPTVYEFTTPTNKNFAPTAGGTTSQSFGVSYYSDSLGNYVLVYPELNKGILQSIQYDAKSDSWGSPEVVATDKKINKFTTSKEALSLNGNFAATAWFVQTDPQNPPKTNDIFVSLKSSKGKWTSLPSLVSKGTFNSVDVAVNTQGNVLVIWVESLANIKQVKVGYYDGKKWTTKSIAGAVGFNSPTVLANSLENGDFSFTYPQSTGPATAFFHSANKTVVQNKKFNDLLYNSSYLASSPSGSASLAWQSVNTPNETTALSFSLFKNNKWTPVKTLVNESVDVFTPQTIQHRVNNSGNAVFTYILNNKGTYEVYALDSTTLKTTKIAKSKFELAFAASAIDDSGNAVVTWVSKGLEKAFKPSANFNSFTGREPFVSVRKGYKGNWSSPKSLGAIKSSFKSFGVSTLTAPIFTKDGVSLLFEGRYTVSPKVRRVTSNLYLFKGEALFKKNTFLLQQERPLSE